MKKICVSTGSFFRKNIKENYNKYIAQCKQFKIDGIELMIGNSSDIKNFKLSKTSINYLKKLKYNTIHAPFRDGKKDMVYFNNENNKKIIRKLIKIAKSVNAKSILFHTNQVKNYKLFDGFDFNFNIENMPGKHKIPLSFYLKKLKENPKINFVIDSTHALDRKNELKSLVKNIKRIDYIHLSGNINKKHHLPLHSLKKKDLKKLNSIKKLKCPFVIEITCGGNLKKEVAFVKKWLNY